MSGRTAKKHQSIQGFSSAAAAPPNLLRTNSQPQVSPRLVDDNGDTSGLTPLSRGSSVNSQTSSGGASELTRQRAERAAIDFFVDRLIAQRQLGKLWAAVRQHNVTLTMLEVAFEKRVQAKQEADFVHAFSTLLPECNSTIIHELAREGMPEHIVWVLRRAPALLRVTEPGTGMLPLHFCALARNDADTALFCSELWPKVDVELLLVKDSIESTVDYYLAMRNCTTALAIVRDRIRRHASGAQLHNDTEALRVLHLERDLLSTKKENKKLRHNHDAAVQEARDLKDMHVQLDRAIVERDSKLSAAEREALELRTKHAELGAKLHESNKELESLRLRLAAANTECNEMRRSQDGLGQRNAANQTELKRATEQMLAAQQRADEAEAALDEAQAKLRLSERQVGTAVQECERLEEMLKESDNELKEARRAGNSRTQEIEAENNGLKQKFANAEINLRHEQELQKRYDTASRDAKQQATVLHQQLLVTHADLSAAQEEARNVREESARLQLLLDEQSAHLSTIMEERDLLRQEAEKKRHHRRGSSGKKNSKGKKKKPATTTDDNTDDDNNNDFYAEYINDPLLSTPAVATEVTTSDSVSDNEKVTAEMVELQKKLEAREEEMAALKLKLRDTADLYVKASAAIRAPSTHAPVPPSASLSLSSSQQREDVQRDDILSRNVRLNRDFFERLAKAVDSGDALLVQRYLELGVNPNTRNFVGEGGQTLLQIAATTAAEITTRATNKMLDERQVRVATDNMARTMHVIISSGGDWDGLDEFLETTGLCGFPDHIYKLLRDRDDLAPFCKALVANDERAAIAALDKVEDFMRVPSRYAREKFTYLHLAVQGGHARLVHHMVMRDSGIDANRRDANDRTPLHLVLQKCTEPSKRLQIVEYLLAAGARPSETCTYTKLNERTKSALGRKGKSGITRLKLSGGEATAKDLLERMSTEAVRYGTPIAIAQSIQGAEEVVEYMQNKRYMRVTLDKKEAGDYGAPLLSDYIVFVVTLHVQMGQLRETGMMANDSVLDRLFRRYGNVFHCYNKNFVGKGGAGYSGVLNRIYADAGVLNRHLLASGTSEQNELLAKLINNDEAAIMQTMAGCGAQQNESANYNANLLHNVCKLLLQCTEAVRSRWFEVSSLIEQPAEALHPRAACLALQQFVRENKVDEIDFMLNRNDNLFGALDVNSVVDEKQGFTPIELAAHCGVTAALDYFLERQRLRIDAVDAVKGTLVSIARNARQSISIVSIDHFKYNSHLCDDLHPNAPHYDMQTESGNTVLAECVRQHRPDLLRFCFKTVAFQLTKPNNHGETPAQIGHSLMKLRAQQNPVVTRQLEHCMRLLANPESVDDDDDDEFSESVDTVLDAKTPRLSENGILTRSPASTDNRRSRRRVSASESSDSSERKRRGKKG